MFEFVPYKKQRIELREKAIKFLADLYESGFKQDSPSNKDHVNSK